MKLPRALDALLARLPIRSVLHPLGGVFSWARASDLPGPALLLGSGVDGGADEARGRVDAIVHVPEIRIARLDLPGVRLREARRVATRRREDLQKDRSDELHTSSLVQRTPAGSVLWLVSAPSDICAEVDGELVARGVRADRLLPLSLALGGLARLLPKAEGDGLTAILWIEAEWSHCVVADSQGWRFDRQIPLKLGFDLDAGEVPANAVAWQEEEHQFVEHVTVELDRTFAYVERHLALGKVGRICICGPLARLESLEHALLANQRLPVTRLGGSSLPALASTPHPASAVSLGGVALGGSAAEASLLPPALALPRHRARARRRLAGGAIAACLLAVCSVAYTLFAAAAISAAAERIQAEARRWEVERVSLAQLASERERAQRVFDAKRSLSRPEAPWSALLVVLGGLMPERMFAERITIAREADGFAMEIWLEAEGLSEADAAEAAASLRGRLAALSLFRVISLEPEPAQPGASGARHRIAAWVAAVDAGDDGAE